MSEYQFYEFLAIDRPLSAEDLAYVRTLSKRVKATSSSAEFTYSYTGLPVEALDLLERCYDAMLYVANWGSRQLAFRLPRTAVDVRQLGQYGYDIDEGGAVDIIERGQHVLLSISLNEEEGLGWIDGEGLLAELAPLRADILRGDLRALYLAWVGAAPQIVELEEADTEPASAEEVFEPPVPPGLGDLSSPLHKLVEFFDIDQDLLASAAQASPQLRATDEPVERWVPLLPEAERNAFLARVARGEAVGPELLRRLRAVGKPATAEDQAHRRSFAELAAGAAQLRQRRKQAERSQAERERHGQLAKIAKNEQALWDGVRQLVATRTASSYAQAVGILCDLRDLADHRGERPAFDARVLEIRDANPTLRSLLQRMRDARLIE